MGLPIYPNPLPFITLFVLLLVLHVHGITLKPNGKNVCSKQERYESQLLLISSTQYVTKAKQKHGYHVSSSGVAIPEELMRSFILLNVCAELSI